MNSAARLLTVILVVLPLKVACAQGPSEDSNWLTPGKFSRAGLHFSPGLSLAQQVARQGQLTTHDELTVEWDSYPAITQKEMGRAVSQVDVRGVSPNPKLVLLSHKQNTEGGISQGGMPYLTENQLLLVAVTSEDEIRSFTLSGDPRSMATEDLAHHVPRQFFIIPKTTFDISIPHDPQVSKVLVMQPFLDADKHVSLKRIGVLQLSDTK